VEAEAVVLEGGSVALAHQEADQALVRRVHRLLVAGERDAGRVHDGEVVGKGICNYSAIELRQVQGMKSALARDVLPRSSEEAVHRDYLVLD